jgi:two-component system sensor histidine kinase KdpD
VITASEYATQVEFRIIDYGPGVPDDRRDQIFLPFQRFGDRDNTTGVGLGLALSRGLVEAMSGTITPETTPGGGLTMLVNLPTAESADGDAADAIDVTDQAIVHRLRRHPPAAADTT